MNIGENIKRYRKTKNMSQQKLSELSNVPRVSISRYENGDRIPNIEIVNKLANALEVSVENLIYKPNFTHNNTNKFLDFNNDMSGYILPLNKIDVLEQDSFKSNVNPKDSLINLLSYTNSNDKLLQILTDNEIDNLLVKVYDLLEFELFKLSKNKE